MVRGTFRIGEPLSRHTTLQIGGPAECMLYPADVDDVRTALVYCRQHGIPCTVLGFGSNVLVPDQGLPGLVLRTKPALDFIRFEGDQVRVGAGASVARLVGQASRRSLSGVEGLAGVPGSVGGALVMNAGTRAGQIGNIVQWVSVMDVDGECRQWSADELQFSYRSSRFQKETHWLITEALLQLEPDDREAIRRRVSEALTYRSRTQPLHLPNAGSVFKNPPGDAAGRLVEVAACKGLRYGDAQVSELHANWIVNVGRATAEHVLTLMMTVRQRVFEATGVSLEPEIRLLGSLQQRWQSMNRELTGG